MKAIVTGASGFVGSQLVAELLKEGFDVAALGRRRLDEIPSLRRHLLHGSYYSALDLDAPQRIEEELKVRGFCGAGLNYFFHLAWGGSSRLSDLDVDKQTRNVSRTINTYGIAESLGATRYVFCGTMEECFAEAYTEIDYRNESKYNRHVVYALAKLSARQALKLRYKRGGPDLLFGTNSHVMGPGDDKDSFLQVCLGRILAREDISMSSGEQIFDVINVKDCARAYVAIAKSGLLGEAYWVGSGAPRSLREYVEEMNSLFSPVRIKYGSMPFDDVVLDKHVFSIERLVADTGFYPALSFSDSVAELANHLRAAHG